MTGTDRSKGRRGRQGAPGPPSWAAALAALLVISGARARAEEAPRPGPAPSTETASVATATATATGEPASHPAPAPVPAPAADAERLTPLLRSADPSERERAATALLALGPAAVPALEDALAHAEGDGARIRALITMLRPGGRSGAHAPGAGLREGGAPGAAGAPSASSEPPERWWEAKFREAARRVDHGDHLGAVKILDAIVVLEPDCPIRDRIQQLRIRAKELQLRLTTLEAKLVPRRVLIAPGDPIDLQLELKNVSSENLDLASPDAAEGDLFGALEVETFDATVMGERSRSRETQRISTTIPARLKPTEVWRTPLTVRPLRPPQPGVFRRLTISGSIRSQTLVRKDERFDRFLPLFSVEVYVVESSRQALAAEPLKALSEAVRALGEAKEARASAAQAERLFFAAMLVPFEDRDRAVTALGAALEREGDPAAFAAMTTLSVLTDRPLEQDRNAWREWIKRRAR